MEEPVVGLAETKTIIYPPWRDNSEKYFSLSHILGAFSMYAIRQSPYTCPENLGSAIEQLEIRLRDRLDFDKYEFCSVSCRSIHVLLEDLFQEVPMIMAWNKKKIEGHNCVSSDHPDWNPDFDFIDLGALARNISHVMISEYLVDHRIFDVR